MPPRASRRCSPRPPSPAAWPGCSRLPPSSNSQQAATTDKSVHCCGTAVPTHCAAAAGAPLARSGCPNHGACCIQGGVPRALVLARQARSPLFLLRLAHSPHSSAHPATHTQQATHLASTPQTLLLHTMHVHSVHHPCKMVPTKRRVQSAWHAMAAGQRHISMCQHLASCCLRAPEWGPASRCGQATSCQRHAAAASSWTASTNSHTAAAAGSSQGFGCMCTAAWPLGGERAAGDVGGPARASGLHAFAPNAVKCRPAPWPAQLLLRLALPPPLSLPLPLLQPLRMRSMRSG